MDGSKFEEMSAVNKICIARFFYLARFMQAFDYPSNATRRNSAIYRSELEYINQKSNNKMRFKMGAY